MIKTLSIIQFCFPQIIYIEIMIVYLLPYHPLNLTSHFPLNQQKTLGYNLLRTEGLKNRIAVCKGN